jgi:AAA domain
MKIEPFNPADLDYLPPDEPWRNGTDARTPKKPKFKLTPFNDIKFETADEWLVKKLLPRKGVAAIYGASGSVKTFILLDLLLYVALGWPWAGRRVVQTPTIYIAAEGAAGLRKRKIGWELAHDGLPDIVPFHLIEVAPNLGAGASDLKELIASIEAAGIKPGAIAIDTVAQSMGVGDENNTGMVQFAANITALANHFGCLVAAVHHVGLGDEKRLRGHSSFLGALDVSILSERKEGALSATLTVMKLKDEESAHKFTVHLTRIAIGKDSDGEEVSTLIVESVETGATEGAKAPRAKSIPRGQRLLIAIVEQAIGEDETAKMIRPWPDGPIVKAVPDEAVRYRYYARIAEKTAHGEDHQKLADRQRQAFYRAITDALKALILMACDRDGTRFLWLP